MHLDKGMHRHHGVGQIGSAAEGPVLTEGWTYDPSKFAFGFTEVPHGEDVHCEDDVATNMLFTTHSLPISFLLKELKSRCGSVVFLGIQPAQLEFMSPLTPAVHEAVEKIYGMLKARSDFTASAS